MQMFLKIPLDTAKLMDSYILSLFVFREPVLGQYSYYTAQK